jgi:phosphatidylserine/phosphatidylglycerophosphate/cardiolipin synthase-like enzyme
MITQITVYFSPHSQTAEAIIGQINRAHSTIRLLMYDFTNQAIAHSLILAHVGGVDVRCVLDRSNLTDVSGALTPLVRELVPVLIDATHHIMHDKTLIIDGHLVITGSYNFTLTAQSSNAETCMFIDDVDIATQFLADWQIHASHSTPPPPHV